MALPGDYRVRLTVGGWSESKPFRVVMDPRVEADGVTMDDLRAQFDFNIKVDELFREAFYLLGALEGALASGRYQGSASEEIRAIQALMEDAGGSYPQPMYLNQLRYLQGMTDRADQRPGNFAYTRFDELSNQLAELKSRFNQITGG